MKISSVYSVVLLFIILSTSSQAQNTNFYYTFSNKTVRLQQVPGLYLAEFVEKLPSAVLGKYPGTRFTDKQFAVTDTSTLSGFGIPFRITPAYRTDHGEPIYYGNELLLKFNSSTTASAKERIIRTFGLAHIHSARSYERYSVAGDALELSKLIYETGNVEYCTPDFLVTARTFGRVVNGGYIPEDSFFTQQWYLHNIGQGANDGHSTTVNADIDAPEAWTITRGDSNITVAIIDMGVTDDHIDLPSSRQRRLKGSNFSVGYSQTNANSDDPSPDMVAHMRPADQGHPAIVKPFAHGNACAGIVGATQDNGIGVTGIAPRCKIMPIKIPLGFDGAQIHLFADGIELADDSGANILSNSWGIGSDSNVYYPVVVKAIRNAIDSNRVVVFAAGNNASVPGDDGYIAFPANIDGVIAVGASDRDNHRAVYSPGGSKLKLVAPSHTSFYFSGLYPGEAPNIWTMDNPGTDYGYNSWIDTNQGVAVGETLPCCNTYDGYFTGRFGGTSAAAPQVAAVAALMKSVNPCLGALQIADLLNLSTDQIGGFDYHADPNRPGHSLEAGYGKLNAYEAVLAAQKMKSSRIDLYLRDTDYDPGNSAGYPFSWGQDQSPDIWVRNQPDGLANRQHQNPKYSPTDPNYVYVRVGNKSCVPSAGTEKMCLYWSRAAGGSSWPAHWNGTQPDTGNKIGELVIPALQPGRDTVLTFTWNVSLPSGVGTSWNSCLLGRIEGSRADPITVYPGELYKDVYYNNNVSLRNCVVSVSNKFPRLGSVNGNFLAAGDKLFYLGNAGTTADRFDLIFRTYKGEQHPLTGAAEVNVQFDQAGWDLLGERLSALDTRSVRVNADRSITISGADSVAIPNVYFPAGARVPVRLTFAFLTAQQSAQSTYDYHAIQKYSAPDPELGDHWTGGVHFTIEKPVRTNLFRADAGPDKETVRGNLVMLKASPIGEAATYNWYNARRELVHTGQELAVKANSTEEYLLEAIAESDGYKDYDRAMVLVKDLYLKSLVPNPARDLVTVGYMARGAVSASLVITGISSLYPSVAYPLDGAAEQIVLNTAAYPPGIYAVTLICDGKKMDEKTLQIQR